MLNLSVLDPYRHSSTARRCSRIFEKMEAFSATSITSSVERRLVIARSACCSDLSDDHG
ncbi:hypothetical protein ES707_05829 [subsurface metagenome]